STCSMLARVILFLAHIASAFLLCFFFFFQAEDGIRDLYVTGVQTCALPICTSESAICATMKAALNRRLATASVPRSPSRSASCRSEERRVGKECRSRGAPEH